VVKKSSVEVCVCPSLWGAIDEIALSAGFRGLPFATKLSLQALMFNHKNV